MYFNMDNVENPLEFIRDRLDVHIKCQVQSKCEIKDINAPSEMLDEKESHNRSGNDSEESQLVIDESMNTEEIEEIESFALDEPKIENLDEFHQVSDNSLVDGQILQTIIEKDETECEENEIVLEQEKMIIDEKVPISIVHPVTQPEAVGCSEEASVPHIEESCLPNEMNENAGIVNEINNTILDNVFENAQEQHVQENVQENDNDQPDSDEAVPFYDAPEEMETNQEPESFKKTEIEQLNQVAEVQASTIEVQKEQLETLENMKVENEDEKEEPEPKDEDQIDSQCIFAPDITFGDFDGSNSFSSNDDSAEHIKELNELVSKRKLSILPDDPETIYLASKSFKIDNESCTID